MPRESFEIPKKEKGEIEKAPEELGKEELFKKAYEKGKTPGGIEIPAGYRFREGKQPREVREVPIGERGEIMKEYEYRAVTREDLKTMDRVMELDKKIKELLKEREELNEKLPKGLKIEVAKPEEEKKEEILEKKEIEGVAPEKPEKPEKPEEKVITLAVEEITPTLPSEKQEEIKKPGRFKALIGAVGEKLKIVKIFGQSLPEFLAGMAAGAATRTTVRLAALGAGGLGVAALGGAAAGGVTAGLRQCFKERREYNAFTKTVKGEAKEVAPETIANKIEELKVQLNQEANPKKREILSDQLRYLMVEVKRGAKKEKVDLKTKVEAIIKARKEGVAGVEKTERERLFQQISRIKLVERKKLAKAVLRGAIFGAAGGIIGGVIAEWIDGNLNLSKTPEVVPSEVVPPTPEVIPPLEVTPSVSEVLPPPEVLPVPEVPPLILEGISPEIAALPETIRLPVGSNPWNEMAKYLENFSDRTPTNAEILAVTKEVAKASNIKVPEWGLMEGTGQRFLPSGFELKITPEAKRIIQNIIEGKRA